MTKLVVLRNHAKTILPFNFFLRHAGVDLPAAEVAQAAAQRGDLPVTFLDTPRQEGDPFLIDGALAVAGEVPANAPPPQPGLGYAGFSALQRAALHEWLEHPAAPAPLAFQQLLLANAEVRLLESAERAAQVHASLLLLTGAPWHGHEGLARTLLLSFWLRQDGKGLVKWLGSAALPAALWRLALGLQALLGQPLHPAELPLLAAAWELPVRAVDEAVLRLRLDSLQSALGQEPLAYAVARLGDAARTPQPWRCQHRDLRLALPQPDVRPLLEPLLRDLLAVVEPAEPEAAAQEVDVAPPTGEAKVSASPTEKGAKKRKQGHTQTDDRPHLILEFGASRSDVFDYVLRQAQRQPGFQQIMDENRHMVYRVPFRRSDMRHFWQIWTYVQNWSSMRIYCEGRQLDKWQVYPYSQYLR